MNVLIIEDEELASRKLIKTLLSVEPDANVVAITDSVEASVAFLRHHTQPDLILMDIELTDGQSFEIFNQFEVGSRVIFTTSYDEHALKAFKVNSIDYLLKPVQQEELAAAIGRYKQMSVLQFPSDQARNFDKLLAALQQIKPKSYRKRFLVKNLQRLVSINVEEIAYFYADEKLNFFKTFENARFIVDYTLDELEAMLEPDRFFRISRSHLVSTASIVQIHDYFGHRLLLNLRPVGDREALVSREKVSDFKEWLGK